MRRDLDNELYQPELPPLDEGGKYLVDYLFEVGPVESGGLGAGPVTHRELYFWQLDIGLELDPWEIRMLRRLSIAYLQQHTKSVKGDCKPPWDVEEARDHAVVAKSMQQSILELSKL